MDNSTKEFSDIYKTVEEMDSKLNDIRIPMIESTLTRISQLYFEWQKDNRRKNIDELLSFGCKLHKLLKTIKK
jgi:hypothetical protein